MPNRPPLPPADAGGRPRLRLPLLAAVAGAALCGALGCQEPTVATYSVANEHKGLVVAVLPQADATYFVKLVAPLPLVEAHRKEFDAFVQSIRFTGKGKLPFEYQLPEGWKVVERKEPFRVLTLQAGTDADPVEVAVSSLGKDFGGTLENVNRWRKQLGLDPVTEADLKGLTKELKVGDVKGTLVEFDDRPGPVPPRPPKLAAGTPTYKLPQGWEKAANDQFSKLAFETGKDESLVRITAAPLGALALEQNVNRWRGQVGLDPLEGEEAVRSKLRPVTVDGTEAFLVDLTGPGGKDGLKHIVGVLAQRGKTVWSFKMQGKSAEAVAAQLPAFEEWLKSLQYTAGEGAPHGR